MRTTSLIIMIMAIVVILFVPVYLKENTLGNYLLAAFIITETSLFVIRQWLEEPRLSIETEAPFVHDISIFHTLLVRNNGRRGAEGCEGKLTLNITPDDVIDGYDGWLTRTAFKPLREANVSWSKRTGGNRHEVSIKAKGSESLEIVRLVKVPQKMKDGHPIGQPLLLFQIPSEKGWDPIRVALAPKNYEGRIRIESMNSEPAEKGLRIEFNKGDVFVKLLDDC